MSKHFLTRLAPFDTCAISPAGNGSIIKLRGCYYLATPAGEDVVDLMALSPEEARQTIQRWDKRS